MRYIISLVFILISIISIRHINKKYGIKKVEKLLKILCIVASIAIFIVAKFMLDNEGKSGTLVESLGFPSLFMLVYFFMHEKTYNDIIRDLKTKRPPFSYLTFLTFWITMAILFIMASVVSTVNYIVTGSYQTFLQTY